jgi:thiazole/oxazole-forming peptide maturase SagD family component
MMLPTLERSQCLKLLVQPGHRALRAETHRLLRRMLSPLCGFDQHISFIMRNRREPRFVTTGAELCGVHVLRNRPRPGVGAYHIGGSGVCLEEALIRTLAETVERYGQMVSEVSGRHQAVFASHTEMAARGESVLDFDSLRFFSDRQHARLGFPFHAPSPDMPMSWIKAPSLLDSSATWMPSQVLLVGYTAKEPVGERRCVPGVTTGTAAHVTPEDALRNALLELVQIDAAMGHWYSSAGAQRIVLDERTEMMRRIIRRQFPSGAPDVAFYWLPNPDLPAFTIACTLRQGGGQIPQFVAGLGCELELVPAMYKALLETVAIRQLAKVTLLDRSIGERAESGPIDPDRIFDLDSNVAYYATGGGEPVATAKFSDQSPIGASNLPPDWKGNARQAVRMLVHAFRDTGKRLVFIDLTTQDIRDLGFWVIRVWSPDTLSLSLPSCPPDMHARFRAYGGFHNSAPHPYP